MLKRLSLGILGLFLFAEPSLAQTVTWPTFVTALSAAASLTGSELIGGVQSAAGVKITPAQLLTYVLANGAATGTITSSSANQCGVFTASTTIAGSANCTVTVGALTLGVSGTAGSVAMGNATSGTVTIQPVTGALGTVTASLPANTGTIAELNLAQTWTANQINSSAAPQESYGVASTTSGGILLHSAGAAFDTTIQAADTTITGNVTYKWPTYHGTAGQVLADAAGNGVLSWAAAGSSAFPLTVSGTVTSGGIPYFNSTTQESSSALLAANGAVFGGGAGVAPTTSPGSATAGTTITLPTAFTASASGLILTGNWNNAGVAFPGMLVVNVGTDTAHGFPSFLADFQDGGVSHATIRADGAGTFNGMTVNNTTLQFGASGSAYIGVNASSDFTLYGASQVTASDITITANNTFQLGHADAAVAVAQILQTQSVVAGTSNVAGANSTFRNSIGTGTGVGGNEIHQVAPAGTTGTSQNSTINALTIENTGHLLTASSALPALTSCGTGSPTVTAGGTDVAFEITEGTAATGCIATFKVPYTARPVCTVTPETGLPASFSYTVSTSAVTITNTSAAGDVFAVICLGH